MSISVSGNTVSIRQAIDFANVGEGWLQQQRGFFAKWDEVLQKEVLTIKDADVQATYFGQNRDYHESRQKALLDERLDESMPPCYRTGLNDLYIEWTYTIDLDREIFSIDNGCHFKLNKIPKETWAEALAFDNDGRRLILPHLVSADSLASVTSQYQEPGQNLKSSAFVYEQLNPQLVRTLTPSCGGSINTPCNCHADMRS